MLFDIFFMIALYFISLLPVFFLRLMVCYDFLVKGFFLKIFAASWILKVILFFSLFIWSMQNFEFTFIGAFIGIIIAKLFEIKFLVSVENAGKYNI